MKLSKESEKELDRFFNKSLKGITDSVADATKFAKCDLTIVAKEIVRFEGLIDPLIQLAIAIIFLTLVIHAQTYIHGHYTHATYDRDSGKVVGTEIEDGAVVGMILLGIPDLGFVIWAACSLTTVLKALVAPRYFLIGYVSSLLPGKKDE